MLPRRGEGICCLHCLSRSSCWRTCLLPTTPRLLTTPKSVELIFPLCAAAYAAKRAELAEERRRREAEREAAKEARKQRMRDYMEKNLLEVGAPFVWHLVGGGVSL